MGYASYIRGYGAVTIFVVHSEEAFDKTYGPGSFKILWNNCETVLALPGQKGLSSLALFERSLGRQSYMAENISGNTSTRDNWFNGLSLSEDGKPLLDEDQIRRSNKGLLFIRSNRPLQVSVPAYAALDPIRDLAAINPFHGKPFMQPVEAWFDHSPNWTIKRYWLSLIRFWKRISRRHILVDPIIRKKRLERRALAFRFIALLCFGWWIPAAAYLFVYTDIPARFWSAIGGGL